MIMISPMRRRPDTLLDYAAARRLPLVLCTTGLSEEQLAHVEAAAKETGGSSFRQHVHGHQSAPEASAGRSRVLAPAGFDIEIVERHHNQKLDAPSGTALALADAVNDSLDNAYHYVYDRSQGAPEREAKEIGIPLSGAGPLWGTTR